MHILMAHELLICKSLIGLLFLMLCHYLTRDELNWLGYYLRDYELVVSDFLLHVRDSLQRCDDEVSQHLAIAVGDFLIAVPLRRGQVSNERASFVFIIFVLVLGFMHLLIGILYSHRPLVILSRVVVGSWLALDLVLYVKVVLILHLSINNNNYLFRCRKISLIHHKWLMGL